MAGQAAKRIQQENIRTLHNLRLQLLVVNAVYIAYRIIYHYASFSLWHAFGYLSTAGLVVLLYAQLQGMSGGTDINGEGLMTYFYDVIYVTWFVHITSMFSDKMWYTYLVIPGYAFYKLYSLVLKPYLASRGGGATGDVDASPADPKKKEKKAKVKYMRG